VKKVLVLVLIMVVALLMSGISDTKASIADTNVRNNDVTTTVNQTDNPSSATATITITMRTPPLPGE